MAPSISNASTVGLCVPEWCKDLQDKVTSQTFYQTLIPQTVIMMVGKMCEKKSYRSPFLTWQDTYSLEKSVQFSLSEDTSSFCFEVVLTTGLLNKGNLFRLIVSEIDFS